MKEESEGKEPKDEETRPAEGPEVGGFHVGKIVYSPIQHVVNDKALPLGTSDQVCAAKWEMVVPSPGGRSP